MAILGFSGHSPLIPVAGGVAKLYGFIRTIQYGLFQDGNTARWKGFIEGTQSQGDEGVADDYTRIIGDQEVLKIFVGVPSNTASKDALFDLRHSVSLSSWETQANLITITASTTGKFSNTALSESMNDNGKSVV